MKNNIIYKSETMVIKRWSPNIKLFTCNPERGTFYDIIDTENLFPKVHLIDRTHSMRKLLDDVVCYYISSMYNRNAFISILVRQDGLSGEYSIELHHDRLDPRTYFHRLFFKSTLDEVNILISNFMNEYGLILDIF